MATARAAAATRRSRRRQPAPVPSPAFARVDARIARSAVARTAVIHRVELRDTAIDPGGQTCRLY